MRVDSGLFAIAVSKCLVHSFFAVATCFSFSPVSVLAQTVSEKNPPSRKEVLKVVYPYISYGDASKEMEAILEMALIKTAPTFGPFKLERSPAKMNGHRMFIELEHARTIDVAWSAASIENESRFLPIRIPLGKGILGYRIPLITQDKQALFDQVKSLEDLQKLTLGQGHGWADIQIYDAYGLKVIQGEFENLFRMTSRGRFDYFPLGISEVFDEYEKNVGENPNLVVEKNLLIYYPWPFYFYFHKRNVAMKNRIELGMRQMIKDGSYDAIFEKFNAKAIRQANLSGRRMIKLNNHLLTKETPLDDASLWFFPNKK